MFDNAPILTSAGLDLLLRAIEGEHLTFTRFKIGSGTLPAGTDVKDLTDIVDAKLAFPCAVVDSGTAGQLTITGRFGSLDVAADFRLRELGLFAKGEDDVEVLYCYDYDAAGAGTVRANGCDVLTEQEVSLIVAIDEAPNVSVIIEGGFLFAKKSDFDAHIADHGNPHQVAPDQLTVTLGSLDHYEPMISGDSLARNLTRIAKSMALFWSHTNDMNNPHDTSKESIGLGNVPNVATNDQEPTFEEASIFANIISGEKISVLFGKIKKAISNLIIHLVDTTNPHGVTLSQVGGAAEVHTHSTADLTEGVLPIARGGTGKDSLAGILADFFEFGDDRLSADDFDDTIDAGLYFVKEGVNNQLPFAHKDNMSMNGLMIVFHTDILQGTTTVIHQWLISDSIRSSQGGQSVPFGLPVEILRRQASVLKADPETFSADWSVWE